VYCTVFTVNAAGAGRFLDKNLSFIFLMLDTSIMQQRVPWLRFTSLHCRVVSMCECVGCSATEAHVCRARIQIESMVAEKVTIKFESKFSAKKSLLHHVL
jgi:hypothetical protein